MFRRLGQRVLKFHSVTRSRGGPFFQRSLRKDPYFQVKRIRSSDIIRVKGQVTFNISRHVLSLLGVNNARRFHKFNSITTVVSFNRGVNFNGGRISLAYQGTDHRQYKAVLHNVLTGHGKNVHPRRALIFGALHLRGVDTRHVGLFKVFHRVSAFGARLNLKAFNRVQSSRDGCRTSRYSGSRRVNRGILLRMQPLIFQQRLTRNFRFQLLHVRINKYRHYSHVLLLLNRG